MEYSVETLREIARDSDTTFKFKRTKVTRPLYSALP